MLLSTETQADFEGGQRGESTVRLFKKCHTEESKKAKHSRATVAEVKSVALRKRGCPVTPGNADTKVQAYIKASRKAGWHYPRECEHHLGCCRWSSHYCRQNPAQKEELLSSTEVSPRLRLSYLMQISLNSDSGNSTCCRLRKELIHRKPCLSL